MRNIVRAKLNAVQAFTPRGGTQLHDPNASAAPDEPQDEPPVSAQQSFSPPLRQNSGYNPNWSPPPTQGFIPSNQPNYFAPPHQYQQPAQYYDNAPQQSPPLPQGWSTSSQQQPHFQQQQYPPHSAQPPQTSPNPSSHSGYMDNGYASSIQSGYEPSISSIHSQHYENSQASPPPVTSPPPVIPSPQRTSSM